MTEQNYRENDPNKYKLSDGTIITESNYDSLFQSFKSTYNSMTNEKTGYVTDVENRNLKALLNSFEEIGSYNVAMEFDKQSRFLAYTHFNSLTNSFDVNHRNDPNKWFEKIPQQIQEEQERKDIETAIIIENGFDEYIHSQEFIEKFGDWEKANRIEELKKSETIVKDGSIVIDNNDYGKQIEKYEQEKNYSQLRLIGGILGDEVKGSYNNIDVNSNSIKEVKRHDVENADHLKSIYFIPDFLTKGTFVAKEPNEDLVTNKMVKEYRYIISGLKINNTDYTVKSAIALDNKGNRYYDHKLSEIEKGNLLASLSSVTRQGLYSDFLYDLNDMRLLQVCQVSQSNYLEQNPVTHKWQPTQEAVNLVKEGKLYQEKDPVSGFYSICDESKTNGFILEFRNAYNNAQKGYESKLTYQNAENIVNHSSLDIDKLQVKDGNVINKENNENVTPRDFLNNVVEDLKKSQCFDFTLIEYKNPKDKETLELISIKKIDDLNQYAKDCKDIVYNSCKVCTVLKEKIDFDHVVHNTKDFFKKDFDELTDNMIYEKKEAKEKYEYFKKNAMELYKAASSEYSIELSNQLNQEQELANAKKTIQEKDKELDIWTAKVEADNKTIKNLNKQLEQEKAYHTSSCVITVPQRDSNGNVITGKDGKPLTAKLNCTDGVDVALGKLSRKCVDLTLENKQLREQLNQEKNRNANSQSDDSWSD